MPIRRPAAAAHPLSSSTTTRESDKGLSQRVAKIGTQPNGREEEGRRLRAAYEKGHHGGTGPIVSSAEEAARRTGAGGRTPTRWKDEGREGKGEAETWRDGAARYPMAVDTSPQPTSYASSATPLSPATHGRRSQSSGGRFFASTCGGLPLSPPHGRGTILAVERGSLSPYGVPRGSALSTTSSVPDGISHRPPLPLSSLASSSAVRRSESTLRHYAQDTRPPLSSSARQENESRGHHSSVRPRRSDGSMMEGKRDSVSRHGHRGEAVAPSKRSTTREAEGHEKARKKTRSVKKSSQPKGESGRRAERKGEESRVVRRHSSLSKGSARAAAQPLFSTADASARREGGRVPSHRDAPEKEEETRGSRQSLPPRRSLLPSQPRSGEVDKGGKGKNAPLSRLSSSSVVGVAPPLPLPPRHRDPSEAVPEKDAWGVRRSGRSSDPHDGHRKEEGKNGMGHRLSTRLSTAASTGPQTTSKGEAAPQERHPLRRHSTRRKTGSCATTVGKTKGTTPHPHTPTRHSSRLGKKSSVGSGMAAPGGKTISSPPTHRERVSMLDRGSGRYGHSHPEEEEEEKENQRHMGAGDRQGSRHRRTALLASRTSTVSHATEASPLGHRPQASSAFSQGSGRARKNDTRSSSDLLLTSPLSRAFPARSTTTSRGRGLSTTTTGHTVEPDPWDLYRKGTTAAILHANDAPLRISYRKGMLVGRGSCDRSSAFAGSSSSLATVASPFRSSVKGGVHAFPTRSVESDGRQLNSGEEGRERPSRPTVGRFSSSQKIAPGRVSRGL